MPVEAIGQSGQQRLLASQSKELQVLIVGVFAELALQKAQVSQCKGSSVQTDDRAELEFQEFHLVSPDESAELKQQRALASR